MSTVLNRRIFLCCLPAALAAIVATAHASPALLAVLPPDQAPMDDDVDLDDREIVDRCESCSAPLHVGDLHFAYRDGPVFCEACAPTWSDMRDMHDEMRADGIFEQSFEDPYDAGTAEMEVKLALLAGGGERKNVWRI